MKPIKKRAVSGNNLTVAAEGSRSSSDAAPVSTTKVNNDSISSPNNPTSSTNTKSTTNTTPPNPQPQSSTRPSNTTKNNNNTTIPTKRSHKKRESTNNNKTQQPLFAFNAASPLINDPNNLSSTNSSSNNNSTSQIGIRPKRKLKQITRFNPYSSTNHTSQSNVKCGEGFSCPRCNYVCSYDSKQCEECELECYYEAGVGVVTLKERRVSLVSTATGSSGSKGSGKKREGRDRKLEVKRLSDMGKGIRRKSAPPAVTTADSATPAALSRGVDDNGDADTSGDLILTQKQSKDTTASNNTSSNTSTIPNNNNTAPNNNIETKKVGGRPAKSRSSITNVNNSLYQGAIINPLKCPHCSKDFLSEKGLQYHVDKKVCQRKHGNAGSNNNKPNTGAPARGRPPNKVKKQQQPPPPRSRQHNNMGGKSLTEITGEGAGIIITPDTPRRVVTRGRSSGSAKDEEGEEDDDTNNNNAAAAEEEEEAAAVSAIREMASLLVMGATQVADSTTPPTPKQPADDSEEEVQSNKGRETRSNRKKRGLDSTASLDAALTKAMLKQDHQDIQQQADESSVTSATSASSGDSSSPFSSVSSAAVGRRRGETAAAVDGKASSGRGHPSLPVITETNVVSTNNNSSNRSTRRTRTTSAVASSSKTTPPIAHDPQVAQQLAKLQSKYKSLLATAKRAKQDNAAKISNLESSLQSKEEEVILANTRISSLEDDKDDLTKKLAAIDPINYNPLFDDPDNNSSKKNDDNSKLSSSLPQDNNNHSASINNKMSAEEDISNCSSSEEKSVEELQHKLEEIINERDSAEEQIKELFGVQLQKDELLSQLQRTRNRLTESETKRKRDRAEFEEREKVANDDALMQRRKIIQLESLLSVVVGQRDRANSRVRDLLLGGKEDPSIPRKEDNSNSQVEKMLASFKSENEHLATEAKESKAETAILQSEKDDAIKQSTQLQVSVDELRNQVDTLRSQNFNLQQDNSFERSFQSDHDECLRVLESVNITNNLEDVDESLGRSPDSLNDSLSSEDIEALPPDIMSPRSTSAAVVAAPHQQEEDGISTPQRGSPSRKQTSDSTRGNEEGTSILNVPSLAEAQSEEAEENKLEELTNALDSLNEFEDFLLDLGLNSPQPR